MTFDPRHPEKDKGREVEAYFLYLFSENKAWTEEVCNAWSTFRSAYIKTYPNTSALFHKHLTGRNALADATRAKIKKLAKKDLLVYDAADVI